MRRGHHDVAARPRLGASPVLADHPHAGKVARQAGNELLDDIPSRRGHQHAPAAAQHLGHRRVDHLRLARAAHGPQEEFARGKRPIRALRARPQRRKCRIRGRAGGPCRLRLGRRQHERRRHADLSPGAQRRCGHAHEQGAGTAFAHGQTTGAECAARGAARSAGGRLLQRCLLPAAQAPPRRAPCVAPTQQAGQLAPPSPRRFLPYVGNARHEFGPPLQHQPLHRAQKVPLSERRAPRGGKQRMGHRPLDGPNPVAARDRRLAPQVAPRVPFGERHELRPQQAAPGQARGHALRQTRQPSGTRSAAQEGEPGGFPPARFRTQAGHAHPIRRDAGVRPALHRLPRLPRRHRAARPNQPHRAPLRPVGEIRFRHRRPPER